LKDAITHPVNMGVLLNGAEEGNPIMDGSCVRSKKHAGFTVSWSGSSAGIMMSHFNAVD
jgi:hypothetical protein